MSMNVGAAEETRVISTINTTPLVDVMLVLLIIFLITIPVVITSIPVELPKERNDVPTETKPENIILAVDQAGNIYWNELADAIDRRADRPLEEGRGAVAAARGADPRRRPRELRRRGPDHLCVLSAPASRRSGSSPSRRRAAAERAVFDATAKETQTWQ